jgi:hypothetical protein
MTAMMLRRSPLLSDLDQENAGTIRYLPAPMSYSRPLGCIQARFKANNRQQKSRFAAAFCAKANLLI